MSGKYEWEEAKSDDLKARGGVATLIIAVLGIIFWRFQRFGEVQKQEQIDRKTDQYKALNAKRFKSRAEKKEAKRLEGQIEEEKKKSKFGFKKR